jgi:hypothetical protein
MGGYLQTTRPAAKPRTSAAAQGPATESLNVSGRSQALLQMKTALDESPQVNAQLTMQRMLNRSPALRAGYPLGGAAGRAMQLNGGKKKKEEKKDDRSLLNAAKYSPDATKHLVKKHGEEAVTEILGQGQVKVAGHGSGSSGSGQNQGTTDDLARLNAAVEKKANDKKTESPKPASNKKGPSGRHSEADREQAANRKAQEKEQKDRDRREQYKQEEKARRGFK